MVTVTDGLAAANLPNPTVLIHYPSGQACGYGSAGRICLYALFCLLLTDGAESCTAIKTVA